MLVYILPGSIGEERRQISRRLITWKQKQTLKQEWGYKLEAESSSVGGSRPTWAEGRRKGLLFLHGPGSGLRSRRAQGGLLGEGGALSGRHRGLHDATAHVPSPGPWR